MSARRTTVWAALVGVIAALVTLAIAELVALLVSPSSSPLFAVGSLVIDLAPPWLKSLTIALFGTGDKAALLVILGILVLVLACAIGLLEFRRPPWGVAGLALVGAVASLAVATRAGADATWLVPTVLGVVGGAIALRWTMRRLRDWADSDVKPARAAISRRDFLLALGGTAAGALVVGLGARAINAATTAVNTVREALTLPKPAVAASAVPAGASFAVPGITPIISSNDTFYRIDTALQVPSIDAGGWKLRITGMVEHEVEIGFDELIGLPLIETYTTLMCVSNEVGGSLVGNAKWLGYPIRELLARAKPQAGADMVLSRSVDGWTAGTPLEVLLDEERESILAVGMNGEPLPIEHGFPVRMVVPGLYGYVSATKWVVELEVTRFADATAYWTDRGWSALGPVKTSSRIDVPFNGALLTAGTRAVAGVAWAQHTGVEAVEVRIDGGAWQATRLAEAISNDTWRQWVYEWKADAGDHTIEARAIDSSGATQSGDSTVGVAPNGAEGYHTVRVRVS
jgi:DMSO/TMAO reductase YedYZ molybdopterin-dependent catalytic subunit